MSEEIRLRAILKFKLFYSKFCKRLLRANNSRFVVRKTKYNTIYVQIKYYNCNYADAYEIGELYE